MWRQETTGSLNYCKQTLRNKMFSNCGLVRDRTRKLKTLFKGSILFVTSNKINTSNDEEQCLRGTSKIILDKIISSHSYKTLIEKTIISDLMIRLSSIVKQVT